MKNRLFLLVCICLLAGCGSKGAEEETEQSSQVSFEESVSEWSSAESSSDEPVISESDTHIFDLLVDETTFLNEYGYQAWLDYSRITAAYKLDDGTTTGSTSAEIDDMLDGSIEKVETVISENEKIILYRYPDVEGGEYSEVSSFLSELSFYFINDSLVFSSVTPGLYQLYIDQAQPYEVLGNLYTVDELKQTNAQILTIAESMVNGELLRQIMVPGQEVEGQQHTGLNAVYFFVSGTDIIQYAYVPFENVSQDFPTGSILTYNSYINHISNQ